MRLPIKEKQAQQTPALQYHIIMPFPCRDNDQPRIWN